jgi:hypothetical protein
MVNKEGKPATITANNELEHADVTSQNFIKFWGKLFAFILYVLNGNSQGFKNF